MRARVTAFAVAALLMVLGAVPALAAVGDGTADSVDGDNVAEILVLITDNVTENAPVYIALFFAVFAVGLAFSALVMYSRKGKAAMMKGKA